MRPDPADLHEILHSPERALPVPERNNLSCQAGTDSGKKSQLLFSGTVQIDNITFRKSRLNRRTGGKNTNNESNEKRRGQSRCFKRISIIFLHTRRSRSKKKTGSSPPELSGLIRDNLTDQRMEGYTLDALSSAALLLKRVKYSLYIWLRASLRILSETTLIARSVFSPRKM